MIRLEPMDEVTFEAWRETSIREYAQDKVDSGNWPAGEALERSVREFAETLPDGRDTRGHEIRSMITESGERVGIAWFAPENRPFGRVVFIYDIGVDPAHRRKGYAQEALSTIESHAREHDCIAVQAARLRVNVGARKLYQRAGYIETDVAMLKTVTG